MPCKTKSALSQEMQLTSDKVKVGWQNNDITIHVGRHCSEVNVSWIPGHHQVFLEEVPKPENPIIAIMSGSPTWTMHFACWKSARIKISFVPSPLALALVFAFSSDSSCIPFASPPPLSIPSSAGQSHSPPERDTILTCCEKVFSFLPSFLPAWPCSWQIDLLP